MTHIQARTFDRAIALGRSEGEAALLSIRLGCRMAEGKEPSDALNPLGDNASGRRSDADENPRPVEGCL